MDAEACNPDNKLALVIRPIPRFGASSSDILYLDTSGRARFVRNQRHGRSGKDSTVVSDVNAIIEYERLRGVACVVLDLSEVLWLNSSGLGDLVTWHASIEAAGGRMVIAGAGERVSHLLATLRLDRVFTVVDTLEMAAAHLRGDGGVNGA